MWGRWTLALVVLLAACSNTSGTASDPSPQPSTPSATSHAEAMEGHTSDDASAPSQAEEDEEENGKDKYYVEITADGARYAPRALTLSLSEQLELKNETKVTHNITLTVSGINLDVAPGKDGYTTPINLPPGPYRFFCRYYAGMTGTITMTEARDAILGRRGY